MNFRIAFAEHCAWRATYVYVNGHQVARIGIDPDWSRASVFGAIAYGWWKRPCDGARFPRLFEFRIRIPFMAWKADGWYIRQAWRNWIISLDGRYNRP